MKGVIWRVGSGRQISIWSDPWLPRDVTRRPITPRRGNILHRVDELIDPVTESCDVQLLAQTFWEEDVQVIRSLPVHTEMDDIVFFLEHDFTHISLRRGAEIMANTMQLWESPHSAGYKTTKRVVRNLDDNIT